jgi:hypothetical protein
MGTLQAGSAEVSASLATVALPRVRSGPPWAQRRVSAAAFPRPPERPGALLVQILQGVGDLIDRLMVTEIITEYLFTRS